MRLILPIRTRSEANQREHWAPKAKRVKEQRFVARNALCHHPAWPDLYEAGGPFRIELTRISPRGLNDDNLVRSMKAIRDGIADALGIDDGDPRLTWVYRQERGDPKEYKVGVTIECEEG